MGSYLGSSPDGVVGTDFQSRLDAYLASSQIGQTGTGQVTVQGINGQTEISGERSLDVGIVAAINPNSDIVLYNGSGQNTPASAGSGTGINGLPTTGYANASIFTAVQSSIWDPNYAAVTSNSWGDSQSMTPGSPFYVAYWELFIDAALRNQTTFIALGDGGSGNETSNGGDQRRIQTSRSPTTSSWAVRRCRASTRRRPTIRSTRASIRSPWLAIFRRSGVSCREG